MFRVKEEGIEIPQDIPSRMSTPPNQYAQPRAEADHVLCVYTGKLEIPTWVDLVKTGTHKELAPYDPVRPIAIPHTSAHPLI